MSHLALSLHSWKLIEIIKFTSRCSTVYLFISQAFSKNGNPTIKTKNTEFQKSIGQRVELSFWDYYAINMAYCSGKSPVCSCILVTLLYGAVD